MAYGDLHQASPSKTPRSCSSRRYPFLAKNTPYATPKEEPHSSIKSTTTQEAVELVEVNTHYLVLPDKALEKDDEPEENIVKSAENFNAEKGEDQAELAVSYSTPAACASPSPSEVGSTRRILFNVTPPDPTLEEILARVPDHWEESDEGEDSPEKILQHQSPTLYRGGVLDLEEQRLNLEIHQKCVMSLKKANRRSLVKVAKIEDSLRAFRQGGAGALDGFSSRSASPSSPGLSGCSSQDKIHTPRGSPQTCIELLRLRAELEAVRNGECSECDGVKRDFNEASNEIRELEKQFVTMAGVMTDPHNIELLLKHANPNPNDAVVVLSPETDAHSPVLSLVDRGLLSPSLDFEPETLGQALAVGAIAMGKPHHGRGVPLLATPDPTSPQGAMARSCGKEGVMARNCRGAGCSVM